MTMTNKKPTALLTEEHQAVLQKLAALEKIMNNLDKREEVSAELKELAAFFETDFWVHFTKEEDALFPELELFIPREAGPLAVMLREHEDLRRINDSIQQATREYLSGSDGTASQLKNSCRDFIGILRDHIHKEDNILFSMADMHLNPTQFEKVAKLFDEIETR